MVAEDLQYKIHQGDREAFKTLFDGYAKGVYLRALELLETDSAARDVVKQVFSRLYQDLRTAPGPFDVEERLHRLTDSAVAAQVPNAWPGKKNTQQPAFAPTPASPLPQQPPAPQAAPAPSPEPAPVMDVPRPSKKRKLPFQRNTATVQSPRW